MPSLVKIIGSFILDFVETIVTALVIFLVVYVFLFQPHQVKGNSMYPSFTDGEYLLTNKFVYRFGPPQRSDIVIFKAPVNKKYDYIKRIVGLPGEKIGLKEGKITVDGQFLDETKYLERSVYTKGGTFLPEDGEIIVPENQYFVIGDNRLHSSDSREWGCIPKEDIIGKAWLRYWPPSAFGLISRIAL